MHLSVRSLHGIRTLTELARDPANPPRHASDLADQKYVKKNYLVQILNKLKNEGLISSKKGPHGGYRLAKPPEEITLGDVVRALEGPTVLSPCTQPEHSDCEIIENCSTQTVLASVAGRIEGFLDTVSIADIRDETGQPESLRVHTEA